MTTDTVPKSVAASLSYDDRRYLIGGCAKGSGMIHPQVATMLAFLTTDAPVRPDFLAALTRVCTPLARELARDGEGASKLIEVQVTGAADEADARRVARAVAGGLLG